MCELFLCTAPCLVASDCPPSDVGEVVCEVLRQGRRCAIQCENDDDCPDTTSCQSLDRVNGETVHLCKGG